MQPSQEVTQVLGTMILYGFTFVFSAGMYASLYAAGRLTGRPYLLWLGYIFAALEVVGVAGMIFRGHLDLFWSLLMAFAGTVYLFLPQMTWWAVREFHRRHIAFERG